MIEDLRGDDRVGGIEDWQGADEFEVGGFNENPVDYNNLKYQWIPSPNGR